MGGTNHFVHFRRGVHIDRAARRRQTCSHAATHLLNSSLFVDYGSLDFWRQNVQGEAKSDCYYGTSIQIECINDRLDELQDTGELPLHD